MSPVHRPGAPGGGVNDHHPAHEQVGQVKVPAQNHGENQRRGVDGQPRGQPPLGKEQQAGQPPGFQIEAVFQEFIGGVHLQAMENGHKGNAQDDHR